ncbi:MAG: hypothetical protein HYX68_10100 [Planctomycetes bacterium]|nr:hypothetical protein [Planctomycetota bacterium]
MLETLDRIHIDQAKRDGTPMSEAAMADEIAQMRTEDEQANERWRQIWAQTETADTEKD